jgi:hypothetical protein
MSLPLQTTTKDVLKIEKGSLLLSFSSFLSVSSSSSSSSFSYPFLLLLLLSSATTSSRVNDDDDNSTGDNDGRERVGRVEGEERCVHTPSKTAIFFISIALSAISLPISIGMT